MEHREGSMRIAFISGKYRSATISGTVANIRAAEECARDLWAMGYTVICPRSNSALFDGVVEDAAFLAGYLEILRRLDPKQDILVLLPNWLDSEGARGEFALAAELGMAVEFWPANRWALADRVADDAQREDAGKPGPYQRTPHA